MKQEEVELLLKDLGARLPYGVKSEYHYIQDIENGKIIDINSFGRVNIDGHIKDICDIKPYLFPLSSMTGEQIWKAQNLLPDKCEISFENSEIRFYGEDCHKIKLEQLEKLFNLFNMWHLDYRGLIPMGLAIDATGLNIY